MFDLERFSFGEMVACSADIRAMGAQASSMEEAARAVVGYLRDRFVDPETGRPTCALARCYKTHPYDQLDSGLRTTARRLSESGAELAGTTCLTLLSTAGDEPEWNDRRRSRGHAAIPLSGYQSLGRLPMVEALIDQLGLATHEFIDPDPTLFVNLDRRSFNVFHVPDANGSPFIPDQGFVQRHGIRSVVGFGGVLPSSGAMFAVILFTRAHIPHDTAVLFRSIALSVKLAFLPFANGPVFETDAAPTTTARPDRELLASQVATLDELLTVRETAVTEQAALLEKAVEEVRRRIRQAEHAEDALRVSEARSAAIIDAALDGVITIDANGDIVGFNPAASRIFGYGAEEVIGRRMMDVIIPESLRDQHERGFDRYLRTGDARVLGRRVQLTGKRANGEEFPIELAITELGGGDNRYFTGHVRDITHVLASETALKESQHRAARIARTLQASLLPPLLPNIAGLMLEARYRPAGDGTEVGGDFYDVFQIGPDDWAITLGDVCGKGAEAAALTALSRYTIRAAAVRSPDPVEVLKTLNEAVLRQHTDRFCTVAYCRLRRTDGRWQMSIACGGHPLPLRVDPSGAIDEIGARGAIVGVFPDAAYESSEHDLADGDTVVFFTDGLPDAFNGEDFLGEERFRSLVGRRSSSSISSFADGLLAEAQAMSAQRSRDDIALLVLRPAVVQDLD